MPPAASLDSRRSDGRERLLIWGVALLTVAAPAAIGGVHPVTQVVLSAGALVLLAAYVAMRGTRGLRPVPFAGAATLAVTFTVLQVVPLPAALIAWLSPRAHEIHANVAPQTRWMSLSVDAPATWLACARGIGCLALLLLVGGLVDSRRRAVRLLTVVAATSTALALVAAIQRLAGSTTILGFYRPRSQPGFGVFGTFVDVNHAASVLTLGALVATGLAVDARGRTRAFFVICAAVSAVAVLLTTSRGALVGIGVGAFVLTTLLAARSIGAVRALVAASALLVVGLATAFWANEGMWRRVADGTQLIHNQKTRGWADGIRAAEAYPWTGAGRGAFESAIGAYRSDDEGVRLVYPEDIVVQMASEWGFPLALTLIVMILGTCARLAPTVARASPALVGGACGVLAVVMHDLMDFGLEFPGVAFPTMVTLAAVVGRLAANERQRAPRGPRLSWAVVAPLVGVAFIVLTRAALASGHSLDSEFDRLQAAAKAHSLDDGELDAAIVRHPADDYLQLLAARHDAEQKRPTAIHHINLALRLHPANWQAHRMAALLLVSMKRPEQAALEYQSALANGMNFDPGELGRVLRGHIVDAVPQTPARLMELARALYASGQPAEADAAAERAVDLGDSQELLLIERAKLALDANATKALLSAARTLLAEAQSADAFGLAARALARAGAQAEANTALATGLKRHPDDGSLFLVGAEVRLGAGDLMGASDLLARAGKLELTLPQRQRAEELLAQIAERSGDVEGAILARARSRLIAKQLQDMNLSGNAH